MLWSYIHRAVIKRRGPGGPGDRGFHLATINMIPGYFHWKKEKVYNQKKSLAV